jgi:hypothetical protein
MSKTLTWGLKDDFHPSDHGSDANCTPLFFPGLAGRAWQADQKPEAHIKPEVLALTCPFIHQVIESTCK